MLAAYTSTSIEHNASIRGRICDEDTMLPSNAAQGISGITYYTGNHYFMFYINFFILGKNRLP